jgi:hypothetical protein
MKRNKIKLLITSVGSLVGQNILDVLDYKGFIRRNLVTVIGTNSIASNGNNFRCDRCYLAEETKLSGFVSDIKDILLIEKPDLILCGRDEETEIIAKILEENPDLVGKLPFGKPHTLKIANDKWESWRFSQKYDLAFAATFALEKNYSREDLIKFIETHDFPLIAKPVRGFASKGVYFVRNREDLELCLQLEDYILQEYLGDVSKIEGYLNQSKGLLPLFLHAPDIFLYSCHNFISPSGNYQDVFISLNNHESGRTVTFSKVIQEEIRGLAIEFFDAIVKEGGWGPVTVQFRPTKNGSFKAIEINMRTNGNTFPKFMLGFDELGLIIRAMFPEFDFPLYKPSIDAHRYIVKKSLSSDLIEISKIDALAQDKVFCYNKVDDEE